MMLGCAGVISSSHFDPKELGNLGLWLDSSDPLGNGTILTSGLLSTFADKSGATSGFSQSNNTFKPSIIGSAQNGLTAIEFGLSAQTYLDSVSTIPWGASFTVIAAFNPNTNTQNGGSGGSLLENSSAPDVFLGSSTPSGTTTFNAGVWDGSANRGLIKGTSTVNTPHIAIYKYDSAGNAQMWIDGVSAGTASTANYSAAASISRRLGCHPTVNAAYWRGRLFELIVFLNLKSTNELNRSQNYLSAKWAIPVTAL